MIYFPLFEKKYIVKLFIWEEVEEIPDKIIPFVQATIKTSEEKIFQSWERYFQGFFLDKKLKTKKPYVVTLNPNTRKKTIWIEDTT